MPRPIGVLPNEEFNKLDIKGMPRVLKPPKK
jgi:hypothetical protein